ncbi:SDR family NAD(P)-dependent oxidoreductase, partial [Roseofilum sp. Belize Diploria]|uniref:SDR family NAD(P)-dependent oxidoreductase n=2 Tax=unclassified Roseofilum TaxID=2620099 RepID=UPI001B1635CB
MNLQDEANSVDDLSIAIIALSGRFPKAPDLNQFWQNLKDGVESISFFSDQELLKSGIKAELLDDPNYVKARAMMSDIDMFDANFFSYSRKEAEYIDPQQRLFLECAWETIERGGYNPETYEGLIGVYAGIGMNHYLLKNLYPNHDSNNPSNSYQLMINSDKDFLATRVAYKLNLRGPAINVQTACSTSLVAVHMACQSLLNGECDLALAGGVSIQVPQKAGHLYREGMIFSPDGHCRAFDAKAKGTIPGDGVGIILLKRLNEAIADGDSIQAIIKGSSINNDGSLKVGYTAPSIEGQAAVISEAHAVAGVDPETISYIEAHGTGTELGDPVEIAALTQAFRYSTEKKGFCAIGSLKSNMGHLDAAAGVAGLIKTVLALKHKVLPPTLHFEQPNPKIDFANSPLYVNTTLSQWKTNGTPRRAGVSSFGIGGTNAHVILEEAPEPIKKENSPERPVHCLTLSAKTPEALEQLVSHYQNHLETHQELEIADICYTANTGRKHFNHRLATIAATQQELLEKIKSYQRKEYGIGQFYGESLNSKIVKIAFLFTGQGSQYINMGRQLYEKARIFRQTLEQCDQILQPYLETSILEIIYPKDAQKSSLLDQTAYTQPALFALEYALFKLWDSWGIKPNGVMGHSVGEYVAACIAGVFSLEDGLKLIAMRGQLMQKLPSGGEMVSVMASESQVKEAIKEYTSQVTIAAVNGPESIVISGDSGAIATICDIFKNLGIKTKQLQVSHAFHSPLMEPMLTQFETVAKEITYNEPKIPLISNVTGTQVGAEITTAEYWVGHVRQPVRFAQSMKTLEEKGYETFLEIGPKPILLGMGRQCVRENRGEWLPSLRPNQIPLQSSLERDKSEDAALLKDEWQQMLSSLGQLYVKGVTIDWSGFDSDYSRQKVVLPTYPFQWQRYWVETPENQDQNPTNQSSNLVLKLLRQGDTAGLTQELKLSEDLTEDEQKLLPKLLETLTSRYQKYLQNQDYIVGDFYDELTSYVHEQAILNYVPLPGVIRGFSWILLSHKSNTQERYQQLALIAQQEIRNIGWQKVDFSACQKVLDIGCGHGTDLITLGQKYNHLELCGYTISDRQVELGNKKINQLNLEQRIKILNGDSSQDEFPDHYDLIYGFEVICHIKKKEELFLNIRNHLNHEGHFVISDFISNASFNIDYDAHSSYLITQPEWLDLLSKSHLKIIQYVDISQEIANGLHDPNFTENLNYVCKKSNLNENARIGLQSYDNLYKMLRKQLVSYVVITAQKQDQLSVEEIYQWNQEILHNPLHYSEVSLQKLFYTIEWQKASPQQQQRKTLQPGTWLVFSDREGVGEKLHNLLEQRGDRTFMVFIGETYQHKETGSWELNPSNPEDLERFCQEIKTTIGENPRIIHLWSLETTPSQHLTQSALESAQQYGCGSVLHLVQAIEKHWNSDSVSPKLWLMTKGSQSVLPSEAVEIAQTPLWGLGKVISLEHPQLWGGLIDLEQESSPHEAERLLQLLEEEQEEEQLAIRNGEIYVARLERQLLAESQPVSLSEEGSYLITGGTGALGLKIAQWLVEKGCQHLVLISRSEPSEPAKLRIESLRKQGIEVVVIQADVSVEPEMEKAFKQIQESLPPLKGVIHAAGVIGTELIQDLEVSELESVLRPKVVGGWILHQLTQKLELEFFMNFSSIASVWGSKGQGHYAAANHFLDGLTAYRQSMGLATYSINWGPWSGGGMATEEAMEWLKQTGVRALEPEKAIAALEKVLASPSAQTVVADINWDLFKQLYELGGKGSFLTQISLDSEAT